MYASPKDQVSEGKVKATKVDSKVADTGPVTARAPLRLREPGAYMWEPERW